MQSLKSTFASTLPPDDCTSVLTTCIGVVLLQLITDNPTLGILEWERISKVCNLINNVLFYPEVCRGCSLLLSYFCFVFFMYNKRLFFNNQFGQPVIKLWDEVLHFIFSYILSLATAPTLTCIRLFSIQLR